MMVRGGGGAFQRSLNLARSRYADWPSLRFQRSRREWSTGSSRCSRWSPSRWLSCALGVFGDDLRRLLADHVNRRDDEEAGDAGKDGGVDDAQALGADDDDAA